MSRYYAFGDFLVDVRSARLFHRGTSVHVTAKAIAVLGLLSERAPEVVSRSEFEAHVWPDGFIEPANLTQTIYMLRKALAAHHSAPLIETVNGRGYRLTADVRLVEATKRPEGNRAVLRPFRSAWRIATSVALAAALAAAFAITHYPKPQGVQAATTAVEAGSATHPQAAPAPSL